MPRFRFALEPLLKARRAEEQREQRAVAVIEREHQQLLEAIRRRQQELSAAKHDLRGELVGAINARDLRMLADGSLHQMRHAQRLVLELAGVDKRLEVARGVLIEAARRRRAVEMLRERRFEAWKRDMDRLETNRLDELATMTAARTENTP
ncbi:MAG: flagellar export protein FliJ [Planctomycetota bacterium]|jgi:flagellar FliJ protein